MNGLVRVALAEQIVVKLEGLLVSKHDPGSQAQLEEAGLLADRLSEVRDRLQEKRRAQQRLASEASNLAERKKRLDEQIKTSGYRDQSQIEINLEQLGERLSAVEDEELTLMVEIDELACAESELSEALDSLQAGLRARQQALEDERTQLLSQLETAKADLEAAVADLEPEYRDLYRERRRPVFSRVVNGICQQCHLALTTRAMRELREGRQVDCDGCGGWLIEVEEGL